MLRKDLVCPKQVVACLQRRAQVLFAWAERAQRSVCEVNDKPHKQHMQTLTESLLPLIQVELY